MNTLIQHSAQREKQLLEERQRKKPPDNSKLENYSLQHVIGRGNYGTVFVAESKKSGSLVALKCISKSVIKEDIDVEAIHAEKNNLKTLRGCEFVAELISTFNTVEYLVLVTSFSIGGDLNNLILQRPDQVFTEEEIKFFLAQIALALDHIHKHGIIYRDLKLDNIVMNDDGFIQLIDFGLSKSVKNDDNRADTYCGTLEYMAPEIYAGVKYSYPVDYWSFGVVLFEMAYSMKPFIGHSEQELEQNVLYEPIVFPLELQREPVNESLKKLIEQLLDKSQDERISTLAGLQKHHFLAETDFDLVLQKAVEPPILPSVGEALNKNFSPEFSSFEPVIPSLGEAINPNVDLQFEDFDEDLEDR